MNKRVFIIIGALVLPLIAVAAISLLAKPVGEKAEPPKAEKAEALSEAETTSETSSPEAPAYKSTVPETLEEAQRLAQERREHLKSLSQDKWEVERLTIMDRNPPKMIEAAIERADWRLTNLLAMTEEDWPAERSRLQDREREKQARHLRFENTKKAITLKKDVEAAFKRAQERKLAK